MATKRKRTAAPRPSRQQSSTTLRSGPWASVLTNNDPGGNDPTLLMDGINGYIPDSSDLSGYYARPGMLCLNHANQLGTVGNRQGQGIYPHTDLNGITYNFCVVGGDLYRADSSFSLIEKVTPTGTTIDRTGRVFFASLNGQLVVSDGHTNPWIASNLASTPITATPIEIDQADDEWSAFGNPAVFQGSMFFIVNELNGVPARATVVYSEPGDPSTGYRQLNFADFATLEQTQQGPAALYALAPTEVALYVFRQGSITTIQGSLASLTSQATTDTVAVNVGALAAAGIRIFGNRIFFADQLGRVWTFVLGGSPADIWKQMRAIVDSSQVGYPTVTQLTTTAAIESTLNLYVIAAWSPQPSTAASPTELYVFNANTGAYQGRWIFGGPKQTPDETVWGPDVWGAAVWGEFVWGAGTSDIIAGSGGTVWGPEVFSETFWSPGVWLDDSPTPAPPTEALGISVDALGNWQDAQGRSVLVALGSEVPGGEGGFVWTLQSSTAIPSVLTAENGTVLTTESGIANTTEGQANQWSDGSALDPITPPFEITTNRLGYEDDIVWNADQVTVISSTNSPVRVEVGTASVIQTLEGIPVPLPSYDTTFRTLCGLDGIQGRGPVVRAAPTDASQQRVIQSVSLRAVPSYASTDDS